MKLLETVKVNEFFSIERMKNMNLLILLFSVVLCTAILVLAKEDRNETKVESNQNDLPEVLQVFQFQKQKLTVTDQATEKIPESVIEALPVTRDVNEETTQGRSPTNEPKEDTDQNVTTEASILPKRHAVTLIPEEVSKTEFTFQQSYSAPLTLEQLESYSCMEEASTFGHKEAIGVLIHEVICEFRKLWHYIMIAGQNLKNEFELELPIETEEAIILLSDLLMSGAIIDNIEQGIVHLEVFLENPENLNVLLDAIEKCVPTSHIHETVSRLRIALSNFFIHLQGFVIYLEPHQSIHNYIELFKGFEEKVCNLIEKMLGFFDIHLETEMKLMVKIASTLKSLLMKFSFEKTFEENVKILKEFIDTLSETYKELHASGTSERVVIKLHKMISTFISTFLPQNVNIPIVHLVLPNKRVATVSCLWEVRSNETASTFVTVSSHHNVTSISKIDVISNIFEKETKFFSELFSCVRSLFEKLCSEQTFEQHLKIFKDCIDKLAELCKEYYQSDCSNSIIDRVHSLISSFVSTLFTQDFELAVLHFNSSNGGTAILKCIWKVTNETSSISPLFSSRFNLTSIVDDIKQIQLLPENTAEGIPSSKSSVSVQNIETLTALSANKASSESPAAIDTASKAVSSFVEESVSSAVQKDTSPKLSAAIVQSLVPTSTLQKPNYRSLNIISSTAPAVNTIKLPISHNAIERKTIQSTQEDSSKYSVQSASPSFTVNNAVPSSVPKVQRLNAESESLSATSLPLADENPQEAFSQPASSPSSSSTKASIIAGSIISNSSSPSGTRIPNEQQSPVFPSYGKTDDILENNSPALSSSFEKAADFLDYIPPTPSFSEKSIDSLFNNPPSSSSSLEKTADLVANNIPIFPLSPEKPGDLLYDNHSPFLPSSSVKPVEFSSIDPSIPPSSPVNPVGLPNIDPSAPSLPLEKPTDLPRIPIPPYPFGRRVDLSENSRPIPSFPYGRPVDLPAHNSPMFLSPPRRPTDFSVNNPPVPKHYPGKSVDYSNTPVFLPPSENSSPSVLFLSEHDTVIEKNYDEPFGPLTPPGYLTPASDIVANLPRYRPFSDSYTNYLESADAFYKSLYSYLQYGNPAVAPPPNVSKKISEFLQRGFPPSVPRRAVDDSNVCGTSAFLPALSALNNIILKKDIESSQLPLYLPRKEIASALGNILLSAGDLIVILPKNGVGLIGQVIDGVGAIPFKAYEVKTDLTNPQNGIKIWHLRSGDFRNPECEQQLELLFKH